VVWGFKWPAASTRRHRITVKLIDEALNLNETEIILCALRSFCAAKPPLSPRAMVTIRTATFFPALNSHGFKLILDRSFSPS
jgi:hypothetical protein